MTFRQENPASGYTMSGKPMGQLFCCLPATLVGIIIESDINDARAVTQLVELVGVEMCAQRAGHVGKARLSQRGIVEQAFDNNHLRAAPHLLPRIQATLAAGQKAMCKGGDDAATVEVDGLLVLVQGKDDAPIESVCTLSVDQASFSQHRKGIALRREMVAQNSAGRIANTQLPDQRRIMKSALTQILKRFRADGVLREGRSDRLSSAS